MKKFLFLLTFLLASIIGFSQGIFSNVRVLDRFQIDVKNTTPALLPAGHLYIDQNGVGYISDGTVWIDLAQTNATVVRTDTDQTISGNKTFTGNNTMTNLTVTGTFTRQNVTDIDVSDNVVLINEGESGAGVTTRYSGIQVDRGSLIDQGLVFDESDDTWKVGSFQSFTGNVVSATSNTITLSSDASTNDDEYNNLLIRVFKANQTSEVLTITDYVGSTRVATLNASFLTTPDNTWMFRILTNQSLQAVYHSGNANLSTVNWATANLAVTGRAITQSTAPQFVLADTDRNENGKWWRTLANDGNWLLEYSANDSGYKQSISARPDGGVALLYDNNTRLETTSAGISIIGRTTTGNLQLNGVSDEPTSPSLGGLYADADNNSLNFYNGTSWIRIDQQAAPSLNNIISSNPSTTTTTNERIGNGTLVSLTSGIDNSAFGNNALNANTEGLRNSAFGSGVLELNTTGSSNSAFGYQSLNSNVSGSDNSAFGRGTLADNISGLRNSAFGRDALANNTTGGSNCAFGYDALLLNTSGFGNFAGGINAILRNTSGNHNVALGTEALDDNLEGDENVSIGRLSGQYQIGHNCTYLGANARNSGGANVSRINSTAIGYQAEIDSNNQIVLGNSSVTEIKTAASINMGSVLKLTPVSEPPVNPQLGWIYVDSNDNNIYFYNGSSWTQLN